ncbi:MAG: 4'-phosphopantetheinyl transferase superfamily protein [Gammaproteobacteria bacterium]|nr:4'-phosphopantetheinyl transferase superfamily protein [Gammaproteobacteria bacterium]
MLGMQAFALSGVQFPAGGKPVCPWFDFSISHSENIAVCAISPNQVVGIDIEHIRAINSAIFKRHLTAEERTQSQANPARFFTYWTQKEAIVKAADCGGIVAIPEVVLSRDHGTLRGRIWYTQQVELQENYVVCLALEQQVKSVQCTQIDIDTLTE